MGDRKAEKLNWDGKAIHKVTSSGNYFQFPLAHQNQSPQTVISPVSMTVLPVVSMAWGIQPDQGMACVSDLMGPFCVPWWKHPSLGNEDLQINRTQGSGTGSEDSASGLLSVMMRGITTTVLPCSQALCVSCRLRRYTTFWKTAPQPCRFPS